MFIHYVLIKLFLPTRGAWVSSTRGIVYPARVSAKNSKIDFTVFIKIAGDGVYKISSWDLCLLFT